MKDYLTSVLSQSGSRVRKVFCSNTCNFLRRRQDDPESGWQSQETRNRHKSVCWSWGKSHSIDLGGSLVGGFEKPGAVEGRYLSA